jgi:hypothetical protein
MGRMVIPGDVPMTDQHNDPPIKSVPLKDLKIRARGR